MCPVNTALELELIVRLNVEEKVLVKPNASNKVRTVGTFQGTATMNVLWEGKREQNVKSQYFYRTRHSPGLTQQSSTCIFVPLYCLLTTILTYASGASSLLLAVHLQLQVLHVTTFKVNPHWTVPLAGLQKQLGQQFRCFQQKPGLFQRD